MTYGTAAGLRVTVIEMSDERTLAKTINEWLAENRRAEVLDIKYRASMAFEAEEQYPTRDYSVLIVYREGPTGRSSRSRRSP